MHVESARFRRIRVYRVVVTSVKNAKEGPEIHCHLPTYEGFDDVSADVMSLDVGSR